MIQLAREELGWNQEFLAHKLDITQGHLSRLETGLVTLTPEVEKKLVESLDKPRDFFFYQGEIEAPTFVLYRRKAQIPPEIRRQFWARISLATISVRRLLTGTELTAAALPYFDPQECQGGVTAIAQRIRRMWKLPPGPVRNLLRLAEDAGCIVIRMDFGTRKIDGCCGFIDQTPVIFISDKLTAVRQRLTIAHELGHLIMHRFPDEDAEDQAFLFASELLMPAEEIGPMLRPLSFDRLARLKLHWQVSMQAIVRRAEALGIISSSNARYYWAKLNRSDFIESEPYDDEIPAERPALVGEIVETYLRDLKYTEEELSKLGVHASGAIAQRLPRCWEPAQGCSLIVRPP